jgi:plasmid stabilization system protein ParE
MRIEFHPLVPSDISRIMEYYEEVAAPQLADEFYEELRAFFQKAAESPEGYAIRERDLRRVNLERFPLSFHLSNRRRHSSQSRCSSSQPPTNTGDASAVM